MGITVNRKRSWNGLLPILFALIYGASPIDLIPDVIPLIGVVDDAIIVPLLLVMGIMRLRKRRLESVPIIHPPRKR